MSTWFSIISRRKPIPTPESLKSEEENSSQNSGQLARVLNTLDLTALGVGSTLGVGVYVLAGHVAKDAAGPAVILSFLIAAVASVFAGLCYAEFGARVPKAGSAYIYSYVCVGEFIAFIIGWNLILEYVIGSASVAKGLSIYLDTLVNNTLKNAFVDIAPIDTPFLADYFDFFSFAITLTLGAALAFGLKESSLANNIFTAINLLVVVFVIIAGGLKANPENWSIKNETIPPEYNGGQGGFFPFGIEGVIKGAATCFYGFIGFDCIATTGEEVKNPQRSIPIAIILSLLIVFLSYFGTSAIITLMVPYYLQDPDAPIPHAFDLVGWNWAKWIVSIGGIFGLCASLFGAMFPLPRIIYAMANDALVFRFLGTINQRFRTPVIGTIVAALLTGSMSALFNLKQLVNMMSIGTLMAYTIVAACVIILRYTLNEEQITEWKYSLLQPSGDTEDEYSDFGQTYETNDYTENLHLIAPRPNITGGSVLKTMFDFSQRDPNYLTQRLVTVLVFIFCLSSLVLACLLSYLQTDLENGELYAVIPTIITALFLLVIMLAIWAQPTVQATLSFKVPLVPLIPALSICINIYLMLMLDGNTWIRFGVWMAIGIPIYFTSCTLYSKTKTNTTKLKGHINNSFVPDITTNGIKSGTGYDTNGDTGNGTKFGADHDIYGAKFHTKNNIEPYQKSDRYKTKNGSVLTIPQIVVVSSIENSKKDFGSVTNESLRQRTFSIDSTDVTNAVSELDKVLSDSENDLDNFEAINPQNDLKNTTILTKNMEGSSSSEQNDNISLGSTNSGSMQSEEHHIEVQIHQEDSDEPNSDISDPQIGNDNNKNKQDKNDKLKKTVARENKLNDEHIEPNNLETNKGVNHDDEIIILQLDDDTERKDVENGEVDNTELLNGHEDNSGETVTFEDDANKVADVIDETTEDKNKENNTKSNNIYELNKTEPNSESDTLLEKKGYKEEAQEAINGSNIPPPPPIQDFLNEINNTPKHSLYRPPILVQNLGRVQLRPVNKQVKTRSLSTSSTTSEGPVENVKTGSTQYNKLKNKLNIMLQTRITLPLPNNRYYEEKLPSPTIEKDLQVIDQVLEQYDESPDIPENFGKSSEFKNELNVLLLRRHSSNVKTKPDQMERQFEKKENPSIDESKHRKLMGTSLKSIRLKKTGILDESNEEDVDNSETNKKEQSTTKNSIEKDREKHKRLMIATLRNIKLRRTGLNLNEESDDQIDIKTEADQTDR